MKHDHFYPTAWLEPGPLGLEHFRIWSVVHLGVTSPAHFQSCSGWGYRRVLTTVYSHGKSPFLIGKPSIDGQFSMAK